MPKPKNKAELLEQSEANYHQLIELFESYPISTLTQEFTSDTMNRNIRDILMHLHYWHILFLSWYEIGMQGQKPDMPAKGYTWKTVPLLNRKIWEDTQLDTLEEAKKHFQSSYQQVQAIIHKHTDQELFEKKRYPWTGSTSLGSYLISNTSSHYAWGLRIIKRGLKNSL